MTISRELDYHLKYRIKINNNVFRYGSWAWGALIREARVLYRAGILDELDEEEYFLLEGDGGELAKFHEDEVLLEVPEINWDRPGWSYMYVKHGGLIKKISMNITTDESFIEI